MLYILHPTQFFMNGPNILRSIVISSKTKYSNGDIFTTFVKSAELLDDMFTKSLYRNRLEFICSKLSLYDIYVPT